MEERNGKLGLWRHSSSPLTSPLYILFCSIPLYESREWEEKGDVTHTPANILSDTTDLLGLTDDWPYEIVVEHGMQ